jgi:MinD-like ATPase involved in chromosome partitioning or flagellar assembly
MTSGAAALAVRLPLNRTKQGQRVASGLAFGQLGGPLVAVCGLVGGSGATTLAFALAAQAANESHAPVLVTEADSWAGGLAPVARQASPLSLAALAHQLGQERASRQPFVEIEPGLRLLASGPHADPCPDPDGLSRLLSQAREAHGLVVVDCGTAWTRAVAVLASATHLLWTLPASSTALARAEALWTAPLAPAPRHWREGLVATALTPRPGVSVRALRRLAAARCEQIVMAPFDRATSRGETLSPRLAGTLSALAPLLRRESR